MFFVQKWQRFVSFYDLKKWIEDKKFETAKEVVDHIFDGKDELSSTYNILDNNYIHAPTTLVQRLNRIWFFFVFFIIIAPIRYVMTGRKGFDERTKAGKWVTKLIGEERVHKAWGYKGGWQKPLSKEEFLAILKSNNVETANDFVKFIFGDRYDYDDERFSPYVIIDTSEKYLYTTSIQRFNQFWVYPLLLPVFLIWRGLHYLIKGKDVELSEGFKNTLEKLIGKE